MALSKKEEKIFSHINIASDDDPSKPEFPPHNPHWPSTPTIEIKIPGFSSVYIKDESVNPTGTHKDRMAWEIIVNYKQLLQAKKKNIIKTLPQMSLISSGSAAYAIQHMLADFQLPNLKALLDYRIDSTIKNSLEKIGCEIYETDLSKKVLSKDDILKLTDNQGGIDITSDDSLGPFDIFYDWMSYDIINQNADYIFVPYGTGHLYENIVNIAVKEVKSISRHDRRFKANISTLKNCHFLGATTNNPQTKADKLYSPHLPFIHFDTRWIKLAISQGYIGAKSNVYTVQEKFLDKALLIAEDNHITCEASGIAGLALLQQMKKQIPKNKKILIVNTGKTKINNN